MAKVIIERDTCVSCGSCWETCPDFFEENPVDSFSQIKEQYRNGAEIGEGTAPGDMVDCVKEASELCPVSIIHVDE